MSRLVGCTVRPRLSLEPTSVERLIDRGLSRTADARRPRRVSVARGLRVSCDAGALSETIAAMLEGGVVGQARALEARSAEVDGRPHARIAVEGRAHVKLGPDALAATWELHGGHQLEPQLRLSFGRDVVLAHGGRVFAEPAATDGVELGLLLPIHGAG
jgi:hypothetical protein